jgi:nitrogen fixation protein NifU and related proteins
VHSETLLEYFRNPRNIGVLEPPAITVDVSNPACGDMLRLSARFADGCVAEARYQVRGCAAAIAAGSALTEWMTGKTRAQLHGLTAEIIESALGGLGPAPKPAAALCVDGAKAVARKL